MNTPFDVNPNSVPWKHTGNKAIISLIEKILSDNNIARYKIYPPKDDVRAFQFEVVEDANKVTLIPISRNIMIKQIVKIILFKNEFIDIDKLLIYFDSGEKDMPPYEDDMIDDTDPNEPVEEICESESDNEGDLFLSDGEADENALESSYGISEDHYCGCFDSGE